jgi:hypothetical protein
MIRPFTRWPAAWKPLAFALLGAALWAGCERARSQASLTDRVARELRATAPNANVRIKAPLTISVRYPDGTPAEIRLDNLWQECMARPDNCDGSIQRVVRSAAEGQGGTSFRPQREAVRATLKDQLWLDQTRQRKLPVVSRPFAGNVSTVYVFDLPDGMRMVSPDELKTLKLSEDELDSLALANLAKALPDFPCEPVGDDTPVWILHVGDSYEASRLLLHDRWRAIAPRVKGDLLVSVPGRDAVYFMGSGEGASAVQAFQARMKRLESEESHPISSQVMRWAPGGWEVLP